MNSRKRRAQRRTRLILEHLEDRVVPTATQNMSLGSLSGAVFEDLDGNGVRDAGEPPMAGVTVYLDENDDEVLQTPLVLEPDDFPHDTIVNTVLPEVTLRTVDAAGNPAFFGPNVHARDNSFSSTGLRVFTPRVFGWSGSQRLEMTFTNPVSFVAIDFISNSAAGTARLELFDTGGTALGSVDSAALASGEIETLQFATASPQIARAVVWPTSGGGLFDNLQFGDPEPTALTDANEFYIFADLQPGDYVVRQVVPTGFIQTEPDDEHRVTLNVAGAITGLDFGNQS